MRSSQPSLQEWRDLYNVAMKFKEIESWNWMSDSDVFGVQDPVSGEIGYCSVMGALGEVFALVVFLGTEGLRGYLKIQSGEVLPGDIDALHLHKCLMASFEDRRLLQKPDLEVIRRLGLKFRGRNSWPLFRSYRPGYHPWYLTKDEARYLTLALQQAIEVSLRFREDPDMLIPPKENHYLVRVPEKGKGRWRDEWMEPSPVEETEIVVEPIDEVRLERIKKTVCSQGGVWEGDFFYPPTAIKGDQGERPWYPYVFLWVDHDSGFVLHYHMTEPSKNISEFPEQFLNLIEKIEFLPNQALVKKEEAFELLEPIASGLNIKLKRVKRLKAIEQVRVAMSEFFA